MLMLASHIFCFIAAAQQQQHSPIPSLALVAPADTGVSVTVYDAGRHFAFARLFDPPEESRLSKYSIVLTNDSGRNIVGVAIRWVLTGDNVHSRETTWSIDSFSTN